MNVSDQRLELVFGALRGEIGNLGLERTDQIGRGIDDRAAELKSGIGFAMKMRWQSGRVGVKAHAQH
jgi:hypothetical protein